MKFIKSLILFSSLLIANQLYPQFTDQINSNRPGKSAGAFSVGKDILQLESGLYFVNEKHAVLDYKASGLGLDLTGRYGFFKEQLEFTLDAQIQMDKYKSISLNDSRFGFRNLTLGAKYLFYDPFKKGEEKPNIYSWKANHRFKWKRLIPAVSGYVGANFAMKNDYTIPNEAVVSPKIMAIAQNNFGNSWVLVTNLVADKITSEAKSFGYILTLTRGINEKWSGFLENRGFKGKYYSDGFFTVGATHLLMTNLQVDAYFSKNIKNTPDYIYGGIGCSWRFDKKHKDVQMKDGKEVKPEKEKKDKDKKNGQLSEEDLKKAEEKANKKKRKNKDEEELPEKSGEEEQKTKKLEDEIEN